jgi:hypothetical protein
LHPYYFICLYTQYIPIILIDKRLNNLLSIQSNLNYGQATAVAAGADVRFFETPALSTQ